MGRLFGRSAFGEKLPKNAILQQPQNAYREDRSLVLYRVDSKKVPDKISGVGTNFGLLVHVLPGPNKERVIKVIL